MNQTIYIILAHQICLSISTNDVLFLLIQYKWFQGWQIVLSGMNENYKSYLADNMSFTYEKIKEQCHASASFSFGK